ncbi:MAG: hypothetical protein ACLP4R_21800, partial [Solirubrobacteraceae bacterium]
VIDRPPTQSRRDQLFTGDHIVLARRDAGHRPFHLLHFRSHLASRLDGARFFTHQMQKRARSMPADRNARFCR